MPIATSDIAPATREDLDWMIAQAVREGWNPGLNDADAFWACDPGGFLIARQDGHRVGCISAVRYGPTFGFMGCYIVLPAHRGRGIGMALWNTAIERLRGCVIGLDGVAEQQDNYARSGFDLAYNNIRFERINEAAPAPVLSGLLPLEDVAFEVIADYDRTIFPAPREAFLRAWLANPNSHFLALPLGRSIGGYGVIRRCKTGYKVGPLFADDGASAERLYSGLCATIPAGAPVYLDVPEVYTGAMALPERYAMREVFRTARMYTNGLPQHGVQRVFGVTSFELG